MAPCKELKCLKYAACKSKRFIMCNDLRMYYYDLAKHSGDGSVTEIWMKIRQDLPYAESILQEEPPE